MYNSIINKTSNMFELFYNDMLTNLYECKNCNIMAQVRIPLANVANIAQLFDVFNFINNCNDNLINLQNYILSQQLNDISITIISLYSESIKKIIC